MELLKLMLDWSAAIAWPVIVLILVLMFRRQILMVVERICLIADRAGTEGFELQLGELLKISFKEALKKANPKTVEEAVEVAEKEVGKTISIFQSLSRIPLKQHHKDLLLKISKGGNDGIIWEYKGPKEISPGRTMGYLLEKSLVRRDGDRYYVHPVVREFIFEIHSKKT